MPEFSMTWFLDGLTHPIETPSHLILLVGLGVFFAQQENYHIPRKTLLFLLAILTGFVVNNNFSPQWNNELLLLGLALLTSLFIIVRLDYRLVWVQGVTLILVLSSGFTIALDSTPLMIPGLGDTTFYNWLFGAAIGIFATVLLIASISFVLRNVLNGIILRVLGSWIATSAIFVLTLLLAKGNL